MPEPSRTIDAPAATAPAAAPAPGEPASGAPSDTSVAELKAATDRADAAEQGFSGAMSLLKMSTATEQALRRQITQIEAKTVSDRREALALSAVREGRIKPAQRGHFRRALDIDERGTAEVLASLERGQAVPLGQIGEIPSDDVLGAGGRALDTALLTPHQVDALRKRGLV